MKNKVGRTIAIDRVSCRRADNPALLLDQLRFFKKRRATLDFIIANIERRLANLAGQSSLPGKHTSH
jgi:hypothetical protein